MPELPEVETLKRQLIQKIIGKKLNNKEIVSIRRRAKILMVDFKNGGSLMFHLKMTGQLIFNGKPSRHTRKVFNFNDGSTLVFNDLRKFGWWKMVKETKSVEENFGPEPLEMNFKIFKSILIKKSKTKIKSLLMDQKAIAGIGNIYSDEILFRAKIKPLRLARSLNNKELETLFKNIKKVLNLAIKKRGSSVEHYFDALGKKGEYVKYHKVYRQKKCKNCKSEIKRIKIGGRSAHFCPICQK